MPCLIFLQTNLDVFFLFSSKFVSRSIIFRVFFTIDLVHNLFVEIIESEIKYFLKYKSVQKADPRRKLQKHLILIPSTPLKVIPFSKLESVFLDFFSG